MRFITLKLLLLFSLSLHADIVVIGNLQNPSHMMSPREVQEIYMGRKRLLSDNSIAYPIDNKRLRNEFYKRLTNRPIEQINAYWARLMFSGQNAPPVLIEDTTDIIDKIKRNKNAIVYINEEDVEEGSVRILFTLK